LGDSFSAPALTVPAVQKSFCAARAWAARRACCSSLVMMTYQLPALIATSVNSTPLVTVSLWVQTEAMP